MDAKDLRIESALGAHTNDGSTKYGHSGTALQTNGNKSYHDIGSNSSAKVDIQNARPCAIIGPDRVLPPHSTSDGYLKKVTVESWPCTENVYQHPPEYPLKPTDYPPQRNISPRQTFQENMQRIMVPPTYVSVKNDDRNLKNSKSMPAEAKYCDVPYTISPINNEPKINKNPEGLGPSNNSAYTQPVPQTWTGSGVNVRPLRPYGAPELHQYSEYPNYPAPRAISMIRPHRNVLEDVPQTYQDRFYHEANLRFKPYSTPKERPHQHPQARYDYIANYPNTFHPQALYPSHKYDLQKSMPPHPYTVYPPMSLKYLDRRMPASNMERYQRNPNQQINLNPPFCNQNIPPAYGSVPGNCMQNRAFPYSPDPSTKSMIQNRLYFDGSNARKYYPSSENVYVNDMNRPQTLKNDVLHPSYPPFNIHSLPPHHMYRKETPIKGFEHGTQFRNIEHSVNWNPLSRLPLQFSPQTISISPSDSNTSNDTIQTLSNAQEDCGYVSQSSTASVRSMESGINRISNDIYRRTDLRYETFPHTNKSGHKSHINTSSKDKKDINVRQFLQMWNEGDDEGIDNNKETSIQKDSNNFQTHCEAGNNQEQLYVLGLVNVPNEELGKYEHIEKISKLPENIKGYNSIELLNQYEKLVESPSIHQFNLTPTQQIQKDLILPIRNTIGRQGLEVHPRPISPLDVEAKISQSVIHKEVGCNFEIRPCSPQIMNVDVAMPVHNVLNERLIEKVVNPIVMKSPMQQKMAETNNDISSRNSPKIPSCKMVNNQFPSPNIGDSLKTNYCLHDMESNSGICLASLPRLDNDIELNFPEINQQFINANKIEPIRTSPMRDLPLLDTENGSSISKNRNNLHNKPLTSELLNSGSESDKEGSKLSKYRKHKRNSSIAKESSVNINQPMSLHRTDSVIIKNPDNTKTQEGYLNNIPLVNNISGNDIVINPTNLNMDSKKAIDYSDQHFNESVKEKYNDYISTEICETAIDFSLNKSDDVQSTCINSENNSRDLLQNNILDQNGINKNIFLESENIKHNVHKLSDVKSPKRLEKTSVSDGFPIAQPNSATLGDFSCHDMLNSSKIPDREYSYKQFNSEALNQPDFKSIVEENLIVKKPEIVTVSSLPHEDIIPGKYLPVLSQQNENTSVNLDSSDNILGNSTITKDNENKVLNNCIAENSKDLTDAISNPNRDLRESDKKDQSSISPISIENIFSIVKEEKNKATCHSTSALKVESVEPNKALGDTKIDSSNVKNKQDLEIGNPHQETDAFVISAYIETEDPNRGEEVLTSKRCKEQDNNNLGSQNGEHDERKDLINISKEDITDAKGNSINVNIDYKVEEYCYKSDNVRNEDDFKLISNDSELKNMASSKNVTTLENNESVDIMNNKKEEIVTEVENKLKHETTLDENESADITNNITEEKLTDVENKLDANNSNSLIREESSINDMNVTVNSYENGNKPVFKKELFSPWLQYLLLHNEGTCISTTNVEKENLLEMNISSSNINNCLNVDEGNNNLVVTPSLNENNSDLNDETFINRDISHKNVDEFITNVNTNLSTELVPNEIVTEYSNESDLLANSIDINEANINHNETIPANIKVVVENNVTESILELTTDSTDGIGTVVENNINVKLCGHVNEKPSLADPLSRNRFPSRRSRTLKRSLSESAIEYTTSDCIKENNDNNFIFTNKRTKVDNSEILVESQVLAEDLTSFIQSNRRNSISTIYNDENVSFCILIDNDCVLTDDNEDGQKIAYTEIPSDCLTSICTEEETDNTDLNEVITYEDNGQCEYDSELILQNVEDNHIEETWVEDVAYMETVFNDDIAEDIEINAPSSPNYSETSEDESDPKNFLYNADENEHTNKVKHIYGNQMCDDDAQLVEKLYRTPQMDVNKTLIDRESQIADEFNRYYDNESLEKILSESNSSETPLVENEISIISDTAVNCLMFPTNVTNDDDDHDKNENLTATFPEEGTRYDTHTTEDLKNPVETRNGVLRNSKEYDDALVNSCESSSDVSCRKEEEKLHYAISSSPEVSSTTSEEKGSGILLKIRSYKGTKISEINEMGASFNHIRSQSFNNTNYGLPTSRPLITKAAQKYIPPLKETIRDLKVKLHLPKQSLYKLQQLKKSKEQPKIKTSHTKHYTKKLPQENPKKTKSKPKFEDVLKSIDEIQFKMHKEKNKKLKQSIPKVIIKKNQSGAHYASTQSKEAFNPDLTGRKWQPWVFLEKSNFIDKMALKQKYKAIYNHRKKTYVLAESFRKYKSVNNLKSITSSKFVITHPNSSNNMSTGKLKYTFRLKHN